MKIIKVKYSPRKGVNKEQFFLLTANFGCPTIKNKEDWQDYVKRIMDGTFNRLIFFPVINADIPENYNRTHFCGYDGKNHIGEYRKVKIPEFEVNVNVNHSNQYLYFVSHCLSPMSQGLHKALKNWFEKELLTYVTDENLEDLKREIIRERKKKLVSSIQESIRGKRRFINFLHNSKYS